MTKVLFVCEGNVNRSQMAATFLNSLSSGVEVRSAGTLTPTHREGQLISTITQAGIDAMAAVGHDMSKALMHRLTPEMVAWADKVVVMGETPGGPLPDFLAHSPKLERWDVPDPGYGHIEITEARDMIFEKVRKMLSTV